MTVQNIEERKISFRRLQGEADFTIMHSIFTASIKADQVIDTASVDDIRNWCAPSERFDPKQNIIFALAKGQDDQTVEIGVSRVSWYTGKQDIIKLS